MKEINGLKFATSMRVLFKLKELKGHKTIQETYALFQDGQDLDVVFEVLRASYEIANGPVSEDQLLQLFEDNNIGFFAMGDIFKEVVEGIMFSGLSPEEVEKQKNLLMNLK